MYGVEANTPEGRQIIFVTHLWEDAFHVWDEDDECTCIIDMETGEVLWN